MNLREKASKIKAIVLDIDGVLTDGRIGYAGTTEEIKFFNVKDGLAIHLAIQSGYKVGVLTGRESVTNKIRCNELKLSFIYEGEPNKKISFEKLLLENNLKEDECMYIGDDIIDIPVLKRAGISVSPADGVEEIGKYCDFRTSLKGGKGAVREAIVWLLKESGKWNSIIQKFL